MQLDNKMFDVNLMSRFINGIYDPTLQNFLIERMYGSFTEACSMAMFGDWMGLQVHVTKFQDDDSNLQTRVLN